LTVALRSSISNSKQMRNHIIYDFQPQTHA
jgi:hypothetical protein